MNPAYSSAHAAGARAPLPAALLEQAAAWKARADAGLAAEEAGELRAWLEADPAHRAALARFDLVWDKFDRPFEAGAADDLLQLLESRSRQRRARRLSALGAVCLVLALGGGVAWHLGYRPATSGAMAVAEPMAAATGAPRSVGPANALLLLPSRQVLPDGSVAELKAGAEIAVEFSAALRRVLLRGGEVHFQVAKEADRPFVVAAGGVEARAVGTAFTVQLSSAAVQILVTEGRVAVVAPPAPRAPTSPVAEPVAAAPEVVLGVGRSVVVGLGPSPSLAPQVTVVPPEEMEERLAWRAPRVEFTRTQLAEAVAVLNGYAASRPASGQAGVQFVIEDPAVAAIRVSGLFRIDRTEAFIGLLRSGFGLEAEPRADGRLVLRRTK
jgi:transmembrane sensor